MLRVSLVRATPGMVLAQPVYHPDSPGHLLLKPGAALDEAALQRLTELRVGSIWIRYPALSFLAKYSSPLVREEHAKVTRLLGEAFDAVSRDGCARLEFGSYAGAIGSFLRQILEAPEASLFIEDMHATDRPLLTHAGNVCFLSLLLGLKLEGYLVNQRTRLSAGRARRIENLGLGALLHDVGVLGLPPEAQARWNATHDLSDPELRRHVLVGFDMVRTRIPPTAAAVVLHHHQCYNGAGFPAIPKLDGRPAPLAGKQIHIFSRIVAVADAFDRLRYPPSPLRRPTGDDAGEASDGVPVVRVLRALMRQAAARLIDPVVFKALLGVVPAYAPGSIVRLSDGDLAVVTDWSAEDPCQPTVRHLLRLDADASEESSLGPAIDLRANPQLEVVHADGQDVSKDNFTAADVRAAMLPGGGASLRAA